jgi:hypothetical protein
MGNRRDQGAADDMMIVREGYRGTSDRTADEARCARRSADGEEIFDGPGGNEGVAPKPDSGYPRASGADP